jgi:hypothetical protein
MQNRAAVFAGRPTHMAHDSQVNEVENRYLRIRQAAQNVPNLTLALRDSRSLANWRTLC